MPPKQCRLYFQKSAKNKPFLFDDWCTTFFTLKMGLRSTVIIRTYILRRLCTTVDNRHTVQIITNELKSHIVPHIFKNSISIQTFKQSTMPSQTRNRNKAATLFCLSALPFANAFGIIGNTHQVSSPLSGSHTLPRAPLSPLFVSTIQDPNGTSDSPVIRSLDAEMEKAKKVRDKYQQKLSTFESRLVELEQKKNQYLEGSKLGEVESNFSETTARSAVKAMSWRVIAGTVTLLTSLKVSGSIAVAMKIVGSDFFSKAFTMFIGERLMNKSSAGRKGGADSTGRSVAKALIWRLFAIANTLTVSYFVAGNLKMASKIAGSDAIFKTGLMIFYERAWSNVEWGKEYLVEYSI